MKRILEPTSRCALHCVLPPYLIELMLGRARNEKHKKRLLNSLSLSSQHRGMRRATTGESLIAGRSEIRIYDAQHAEDTAKAVLVWRESTGGALTDADAENVRQFTVATRDFYKTVLGRSSVDDNGLDLSSYIHFGDGWDNAQWDGKQMEYGDGDGEELNSFTTSVDIVGHELTHGVTQYTSSLAYLEQSGALNESFSDVMGSVIKQRFFAQTVGAADWLIGKGLFKNGDALRSMKRPGTAFQGDPQPADMDAYKKTQQDNGGVHLNSSIPNRAFYESCAAFDPNTNAWETLGPVWYHAFSGLRPNANFLDAAYATWVAAKHQSDKHAEAVVTGWGAVKIDATRQP